jgi:hypothetical protein
MKSGRRIPGKSKAKSTSKSNCPGPSASRRAFLKVGAIAGLGLTLGDYFRMQEAHAASSSTGAPAQSVIYIFMEGGISHIDTFDPKPLAPLEFRGELGVVKTSTGEEIGGMLPKLAAAADKYTLIRSMTHGEAAHERGVHNMLTGYRPSPAIAYPSFGAVTAHELGVRNDLPPYIAIPNTSGPYHGTGYLSAQYGPFSVGGEPSAENFRVRDLNLANGVSPERMETRKSLLQTVDHHFASLESSDHLESMDAYYQRAYDLISSQDAREAFAIDHEDDAVRDEYGRHAFGQRLLLARRLVEAGTRFVTVIDGGWDNHQNIKPAMESKLPYVDQGISVLLTDLERRGLLDSTLVVLATEFGRTVRINNDAGRDHWPRAFSILMAGGGAKKGLILGRTDARGADVTDDPIGPDDLAATIYNQLGIDPFKQLMTPGDRPIDLVRNGRIVREVLA